MADPTEEAIQEAIRALYAELRYHEDSVDRVKRALRMLGEEAR